MGRGLANIAGTIPLGYRIINIGNARVQRGRLVYESLTPKGMTEWAEGMSNLTSSTSSTSTTLRENRAADYFTPQPAQISSSPSSSSSPAAPSPSSTPQAAPLSSSPAPYAFKSAPTSTPPMPLEAPLPGSPSGTASDGGMIEQAQEALQKATKDKPIIKYALYGLAAIASVYILYKISR